MPRIDRSPPPDLGEGARYREYRDWLLENHYDHLCSYCLLRDDGLQVEHYEPVGYAPDRKHDPTNLMLGCDRCNDPGGKGDYHPRHAARRRLPRDKTGYLVLDSRLEDYALLYRLEVDGRIVARAGAARDRASWNTALLKLDLEVCNERRREILRLLAACEQVVQDLADDGSVRDRDEALLQQLLPWLASFYLFIHVFGIPVSDALMERLRPLLVRAPRT